MPVKIPFKKGLGQKFCQPSGTGIDLGFFELDDLSKPSPGEDVFPLVISAETHMASSSTDEDHGETLLNASAHMQITQAVLGKNNDDLFQVKVIRQILWVDGVRYELRELYGIGSSAAEGFEDSDPGKECVICMTEPKDTAVLPCRHMVRVHLDYLNYIDCQLPRSNYMLVLLHYNLYQVLNGSNQGVLCQCLEHHMLHSLDKRA